MLIIVFSATKGLASMAVAVAHSRGLFEYDEKVATYWPEFAAMGMKVNHIVKVAVDEVITF